MELVARAPKDGTTLGLIITANAVNVSLYPNLSFDLSNDLVAIGSIAALPLVLVVHPSLPINSVRELIELARKNPGKINYASGGNGSPSHLSSAYFLATAGINMTHVPYKGTGQSIVDVVGGQVQTIFAVTTGVLPHVKAGKLRGLAVSSASRSMQAPELPTIAEAGYPGFDASFAYSLMAPAGTPDDVVQLLNREVKKAMALPDVIEKNRFADYADTALDARQSAAWLKDSRERWAKVIKSAGITTE
jgi:tripartite-type tricarboxylate transporter receptor subunit TctC